MLTRFIQMLYFWLTLMLKLNWNLRVLVNKWIAVMSFFCCRCCLKLYVYCITYFSNNLPRVHITTNVKVLRICHYLHFLASWATIRICRISNVDNCLVSWLRPMILTSVPVTVDSVWRDLYIRRPTLGAYLEEESIHTHNINHFTNV